MMEIFDHEKISHVSVVFPLHQKSLLNFHKRLKNIELMKSHAVKTNKQVFFSI